MSGSAEARPDELGERIRTVIDDAESALASADDPDPSGLEDVAERAAALVSEADPGELVAALGGDDDQPSSLTEAMARGDPETVVAIRKLLALSALHDDGDREAFERFRELADVEAADASADGEEGSTAEGEEADGAERLREELSSSIDEFRDRIGQARESLQSDETSTDDAADSGPGSRPSGDGTMFSTVPSSGRADMRGPARLSTVRKRQ